MRLPCLLHACRWRYLLALLILCQNGLADGRSFRGKGLVIPLYDADQSHVLAIVRAGEVHQEFARRGFFRIGLLPVLVAQDVFLDLRTAKLTAELFRRLPDQLRLTAGSRSVELRNISFQFADT